LFKKIVGVMYGLF